MFFAYVQGVLNTRVAKTISGKIMKKTTLNVIKSCGYI